MSNKESTNGSRVVDDPDELQLVTVRVPKKLLKAYDQTIPEGSTRADIIRDSMQQSVTNTGGKVEKTISYQKLKADAEEQRRTMDRLKKALGDKLPLLWDLALHFAEGSITAKTIPSIIPKLIEYPRQTSFGRYDVDDFIDYLEAMKADEDLQLQIDDYRKSKFGSNESGEGKQPVNEKKKRYIPKSELCGCGVYETKAEHNPRCFNIQDGMRHGINPDNPNTGTPKGQLMMIRKFDMHHTTSAEEKAMVVDYLKAQGTLKQKVMMNAYVSSHNFPLPFPELAEYGYFKAGVWCKAKDDAMLETSEEEQEAEVPKAETNDEDTVE